MSYCFLFLALSTAPLFAVAASMDIQAKFSPDPANPLVNKFINTTPSTGYCFDFYTSCEFLRIFSLRTPITFSSSNPIPGRHSDPRQGAMFKVPAEWRTFTVSKVGGEGATSSEAVEVKVRIAGIGTRYRLSASASDLVGRLDGEHHILWSGLNWRTPSAPSVGTSVSGHIPTEFNVFWLTPVGGTCTKTAAYTIPAFEYLRFDFGYVLETPEPLKMSQGIYTGSITYQIGPHGDFDMGDNMLPSESNLTLNFTLEVQHTLKVEIPPGGNHIELEPQGGWQAWLNQGRKPVRLFRDQTFNISASSRFKMLLECQYLAGNACGLRDTESAHLVPLNTSVSLPYGLADAAGQTVNRRPLRLDGGGTELFQPGFYLDRKPGTLHFEIAREQVESMLSEGVRKTYSGDVTVIWDSEV
uniref:hypothetical protein n=1 Tax=Pseudomonas grandcourensis TaxID=3136736 RepID=UPI003F5848FB